MIDLWMLGVFDFWERDGGVQQPPLILLNSPKENFVVLVSNIGIKRRGVNKAIFWALFDCLDTVRNLSSHTRASAWLAT